MGSDGSRFALGLVVLWVAFLMFYFAFHPNGVAGVSNPVEALKWLISQFNKPAAANPQSSSAGALCLANDRAREPPARPVDGELALRKQRR